MYGRSRVNVKVEPRSTFTFTRGLSYIASSSFTLVNLSCVRTEKLRDSRNQHLAILFRDQRFSLSYKSCQNHLS